MHKKLNTEEIEAKRQEIIVNSFNEEMTLKRIKLVKLVGFAFLALVLIAGFYFQNLTIVTIASAIYIIITLKEKIGYGYGVLVYKSIIRMLLTDKDANKKYKKIIDSAHIKNNDE
ncbi:MAG: hypothetical protein SVR94_19435 [Pseudomonadota bacterium]|nr:hypothetical protein [Pseudomonadota bacterium]